MSAPVDATISGQALNDFGFSAYNTVEGLALNTFGFLWPCSGIWGPNDATVATSWTLNDSSVTTAWQSNDPSVVTTWSFDQGYNPTVETCTD